MWWEPPLFPPPSPPWLGSGTWTPAGHGQEGGEVGAGRSRLRGGLQLPAWQVLRAGSLPRPLWRLCGPLRCSPDSHLLPLSQVLLWPLRTEDPTSDGCGLALSPPGHTSGPRKHSYLPHPCAGGRRDPSQVQPSPDSVLLQTSCTFSDQVRLQSAGPSPTTGLTRPSPREVEPGHSLLSKDGEGSRGTASPEGQRICMRGPSWAPH